MIRASSRRWNLVVVSDSFNVAGDTVTPGNNTYGTYVELLTTAEVTDDAYGIWLSISNNVVAGVARDTILKVGIDPAGGTSYVDTIVDLQCACAGTLSASKNGWGGVRYWFPIRVVAGSSVAVAASINNATVGTLLVYCRLFCRPSGPVIPRAGSFVRTFGSTPASSCGTAITPVAGSKSAYVQLGSAVADNLWYWGLGNGYNNAVYVNNNPCFWDLAIGDATTKRLVIIDQMSLPSTSETLAFASHGAYGHAGSGDLIYARAASTGAITSGWSATAYGVGG